MVPWSGGTGNLVLAGGKWLGSGIWSGEVSMVRRVWGWSGTAVLLSAVTVLFTEAFVFTGASLLPSRHPLVSLLFPEHDSYRADPSLRGLSDVLAFLAQNPSFWPVIQLACSWWAGPPSGRLSDSPVRWAWSVLVTTIAPQSFGQDWSGRIDLSSNFELTLPSAFVVP